MKITDDKLVGRVVIAGDGTAIGEITRLFVDTATWRVESLQVALRNETADRIGVEHSMFRTSTIEIAVALVQSVSDTVVLSVKVDSLRSAEPPSPPVEHAHH